MFLQVLRFCEAWPKFARVLCGVVILILMYKWVIMMLFVVKFVVVMLEMMVVIFWCKEL